MLRFTFRAPFGLFFAAFVGIILAGEAGSAHVQVPGREVFTGGGLERSTSRDLREFLQNIDLAFVGRIVEISPQFVGNDRERVFTKVTFAVNETFKAPMKLSTTNPLEIWSPSGSYVETANGRRPRSPSELASRLKIGALYFVPAVYVRQPISLIDGLPVFAGSDAVIELDGRSIRPAAASDWSDTVVASGRSSSDTPGVLPDDATAFLTAIRRTAMSLGKTLR